VPILVKPHPPFSRPTASIPKKDLLAQLLALNLEVAARIEKNEPVTPPGIPKDFPDPKTLVTDDCIKPPQ